LNGTFGEHFFKDISSCLISAQNLNFFLPKTTYVFHEEKVYNPVNVFPQILDHKISEQRKMALKKENVDYKIFQICFVIYSKLHKAEYLLKFLYHCTLCPMAHLSCLQVEANLVWIHVGQARLDSARQVADSLQVSWSAYLAGILLVVMLLRLFCAKVNHSRKMCVDIFGLNNYLMHSIFYASYA
jgi:hypothetical protein